MSVVTDAGTETALPAAVDLLVIGLGPAGASAARAAAEAGLSVLAVDRRHTVGVPAQCGEYVSLHLGPLLREPGVLRQRVRAMASQLPDGAVAHSPLQGAIIDRALFDRGLARRASEAGVKLLTGVTLRALEPVARRAHLRLGDGDAVVRYEALAAADGPRSTVARLLGLPPLELSQARQFRVPLTVPSDTLRVWLSPRYPGGYAWLFPRGESANLGVGVYPSRGRSPRGPLLGLHSVLRAAGLVGGQVLARTGGAIPVSGLRQPLRVGQVVFLGDAAGLTHPVTGAGIEAAVHSGEMLGHALDALSVYEEELCDCYQKALAHARTRHRWLVSKADAGGGPTAGDLRRVWVAYPEYRHPLPG